MDIAFDSLSGSCPPGVRSFHCWYSGEKWLFSVPDGLWKATCWAILNSSHIAEHVKPHVHIVSWFQAAAMWKYCGLLLNFLTIGSIPGWPKQNLLSLFLYLCFPLVSISLFLNRGLFPQAADLCNLIWPQLLISYQGVCIWRCRLSLYETDTVWAAVS